MNAVNPRRWRALIVLAAAQFMVIMDTSIIGVALPDMQRDLGFSPDALQWVFNAYVIAFGGLMLLGGRLSDLFGARRIFTVVAAHAQTRVVGACRRGRPGSAGPGHSERAHPRVRRAREIP
ncbi:MFS transporter [Microbispora bryophytorum]|uniref:Major facilitator superfamily (MFS) profile domain-containing protein n=1 Tax=Microbispora bryophytorum TaxID=1460882 RepID=A0A8H9H5A9_9ACTN|nr:MFS transporter [Microbispora bryophytorum]GGO28589.1 hypothetical protein GCM10011574_63210 [Microbispora bryophytorum]